MLPVVELELDPRWKNLPSREYMQDGELGAVLTLVESVKAKDMIEFGVNIGITAKAVLQNIKTIERYVGIDVQLDYEFELPWQKIERPVLPGQLVKDDSRFELAFRSDEFDKAVVTEIYDVAFIDGDHGRKAVAHDYGIAKQIVRQGGVIIFHDYKNDAVEVTGVLDKLAELGSPIKHVAGGWVAYEYV